MNVSRVLRDSWSSGVMFRLGGNGGRVKSICMAEDGEDSASKRAWRTAESFVVRGGIFNVRMFIQQVHKRGFVYGNSKDNRGNRIYIILFLSSSHLTAPDIANTR